MLVLLLLPARRLADLSPLNAAHQISVCVHAAVGVCATGCAEASNPRGRCPPTAVPSSTVCGKLRFAAAAAAALRLLLLRVWLRARPRGIEGTALKRRLVRGAWGVGLGRR